MVCKVAIAGISSKLARCIAKELLAHPGIQLRGSCRDVSKLPSFLAESPQVKLVQAGPYDTAALRSLIRDCEVVICCYLADNETMVQGQKLLIDLCEEESVPRYIASDFTADYNKLDWGDLVQKEPMKHVKAYLDAKPNVQGIHILVGLFMETFWAYFDAWDPIEKKLRYWGSATTTWDITTYCTGAQFVTAIVLDEDAVGTFRFVGHRQSIAGIAIDLESVYGLKVGLERRGSLEDLFERINQAGFQDPVSAGTYYLLAGKISLGEDLDNSKYPWVQAETFQDFFKRTDLRHLASSAKALQDE